MATAAEDRHVLPRNRQVGALLVLLAVLVVDGLDLQILAFAAPAILKEWGVSKAQFSWAIAAAPMGMAVGTFFGGWLGDRLGRRVVIVWSCAFFCLLTFAAPFSNGILLLSVIRFFSGIGFGAVAPNAFMLAVEISPKAQGSKVTGLMAIGTALGGVFGGSLALLVLARFGWQACFFVSSAITAVIFLASLFLIPESPAWKIRRNSPGEKRPAGMPPPAEGSLDGATPRVSNRLFDRAHSRKNVGVILSFFSYAFVSYAFLTWMPTVLQVAGLPPDLAIQCGIAYNACAILASLSAGWLIDSVGTRTTIQAAVGLGVVALGGLLYLVGGAPPDGQIALLSLAASGLVGLSTGITVPAVYLIVSASYDVELRATAAGMGGTAARMGGILVSFSGGSLLAVGQAGPFLFLAVLLAVTLLLGVSAGVINTHVARRA
jgi:AAHS family 4-hydroxybenzoate transporter-like MFS transporter